MAKNRFHDKPAIPTGAFAAAARMLLEGARAEANALGNLGHAIGGNIGRRRQEARQDEILGENREIRAAEFDRRETRLEGEADLRAEERGERFNLAERQEDRLNEGLELRKEQFQLDKDRLDATTKKTSDELERLKTSYASALAQIRGGDVAGVALMSTIQNSPLGQIAINDMTRTDPKKKRAEAEMLKSRARAALRLNAPDKESENTGVMAASFLNSRAIAAESQAKAAEEINEKRERDIQFDEFIAEIHNDDTIPDDERRVAVLEAERARKSNVHSFNLPRITKDARRLFRSQKAAAGRVQAGIDRVKRLAKEKVKDLNRKRADKTGDTAAADAKKFEESTLKLFRDLVNASEEGTSDKIKFEVMTSEQLAFIAEKYPEHAREATTVIAQREFIENGAGVDETSVSDADLVRGWLRDRGVKREPTAAERAAILRKIKGK